MGTAPSKLEKKGSKVKGRLELIGKRANESVMEVYDHIEKRNEKYGVDANIPNAAALTEQEAEGRRSLFPEMGSEASNGCIPKFTNVPNAAMGEQIAAGWPRWLAEAASEAIRGWIPRSADSFNKLDKIGTGTYSNVYKAYDRQNNKIVALKKVRVDTSDIESVKFMAREILILRRLDHQNIIKLEGLGTTRMEYSLYLIFEYMAHDLSRIISRPGVQLTEPEVKCYMHQLLSGIEYCHSHGVLHRDIKSSNIMIDDLGRLKIIDFGLSTSYDPNTALTSRVGTLWYRSPELLLGATFYGPAVDLWSAGCVLGELYTNRPIMPGRNEIEQLYKIFKLCGTPSDDYFSEPLFDHQISFRPPTPFSRCIAEAFSTIPTAALGLIDTLLSIDPDHRGTATAALNSEFFTSEPIACDPSSIPSYQPINRSNAEIVEEESSRITDKRHDYDVRGRKVRHFGLAVSKLDQHGFKGKKIDSSSELMGVSGNVLHDRLWEPKAKAIVGELEVHENLLHKDSGYVGVFGISSSYGVQMLQDKNMHESGTEKWREKQDRNMFQAISESLRLEKTRLGKFQTQERRTRLNPLHSDLSFDSAKKIDELLEEHDRQIQEAVERSKVERKMVKTACIKVVSNS